MVRVKSVPRPCIQVFGRLVAPPVGRVPSSYEQPTFDSNVNNEIRGVVPKKADPDISGAY